MHECPDCGQACDCDGEDTWHEWDSEEAENCSCGCEGELDDFEDDDFYDAGEDDTMKDGYA